MTIAVDLGRKATKQTKGTLAIREYPKCGISSVSSVSVLFVKKINNIQVQKVINLKTSTALNTKWTTPIAIVSMCKE